MTLESFNRLLKEDKELRKLLEENDDFIYSKRFEYSLKKALDRYPNGIPTKTIAQVLLITEEEVEKITQDAILSLREMMKVNL